MALAHGFKERQTVDTGRVVVGDDAVDRVVFQAFECVLVARLGDHLKAFFVERVRRSVRGVRGVDAEDARASRIRHRALLRGLSTGIHTFGGVLFRKLDFFEGCNLRKNSV